MDVALAAVVNDEQRPRWLPLAATISLAVALLAASCGERAASSYLVLATTTSVGNSGLLNALLPVWNEAARVEIRPTLVGSGRALRMLENGQADIVISHAPDAEAAMLERHRAWRYRKIMYSDFVLVGPPTDPARARTAATLEEALSRIARSKAIYVSRGDQSGTHERERLLWKIAGVSPPAASVITSGAGMATTLRQTSEREAYTLADRPTFAQLTGSVQLEIVWQRHKLLVNTYAVITDEQGARSDESVAFQDWLVTGRGRDVIAAYRIRGSDVAPFVVWPVGAAHEPHTMLH